MKKYSVVIEKTQNGKVLGREERFVESYRKPRIGEGYRQLSDPPIEFRVVEVFEIEIIGEE